MGKLKRTTLIVLGVTVMVCQWNLNFISVRAAEAEGKGNEVAKWGLDKVLESHMDDVEDEIQEKISELIDEDPEKMILYQGAFEMFKNTKDDITSINEDKEAEKTENPADLNNIYGVSFTDTTMDTIIKIVEDRKDELEKLDFSDKKKIEYENKYGQEFIDWAKEEAQKKFGEDVDYDEILLLDAHKVRMEQYETGVEIFEGAWDIGKECLSDDPDKWLKAYLAGGDLLSDMVDHDSGVGAVLGTSIWELNKSLWENLMETDEYEEFVEENKDNFTQAFWECTWEGWKDCIADIPRELCNLFGIGNTGHDFDFSYTPKDIEVKIWDPITMEFKCSTGVSEYNKKLNLTTIHGSLDGAHVVIEWGMSINDLDIKYYEN